MAKFSVGDRVHIGDPAGRHVDGVVREVCSSGSEALLISLYDVWYGENSRGLFYERQLTKITDTDDLTRERSRSTTFKHERDKYKTKVDNQRAEIARLNERLNAGDKPYRQAYIAQVNHSHWLEGKLGEKTRRINDLEREVAQWRERWGAADRYVAGEKGIAEIAADCPGRERAEMLEDYITETLNEHSGVLDRLAGQ